MMRRSYFIYNKDENIHRYAVRWKKEEKECEREKEREIERERGRKREI